MKIVFMGTSDFAVPSLLALLASPAHEVLAVVTQPDKPKGRGNKLSVSPIKEEALKHSLPVLQPVRIKRKVNVAKLAALGADIFIAASYGQILSQEILDMPLYGCICVHASLLPKYRGASPIQQAILHGDADAGVTIMQMDAGVDTGDMLLSRAIPITDDDTGGTLHDKLAVLGAEALMECLPLLTAGTTVPVPQSGDFSLAPMLTKDMGRIDWTLTPCEIVNLVRGLNPWPCAFAMLDGKPLRIFRADTVEGNGAPGEILSASSKTGFTIAANGGAVRIREMQAQNSKRMTSEAYLLGHTIPIGTILQ